MPHFVDVKLNDLLSVPPPYVDTILLLSISVYTQVRTISTTTLAHFFLIFILPVRSWRDYFFFLYVQILVVILLCFKKQPYLQVKKCHLRVNWSLAHWFMINHREHG